MTFLCALLGVWLIAMFDIAIVSFGRPYPARRANTYLITMAVLGLLSILFIP